MARHEKPDEDPILDRVHDLIHGADHKDWDVTKHGRMREHATGPEDEPATVLYEGD